MNINNKKKLIIAGVAAFALTLAFILVLQESAKPKLEDGKQIEEFLVPLFISENEKIKPRTSFTIGSKNVFTTYLVDVTTEKGFEEGTLTLEMPNNKLIMKNSSEKTLVVGVYSQDCNGDSREIYRRYLSKGSSVAFLVSVPENLDEFLNSCPKVTRDLFEIICYNCTENKKLVVKVS